MDFIVNTSCLAKKKHFVLQFYLEPKEKLAEAVAEKHLPPEEFITLKHGESKIFGDNYNSVD